MKERQKTKIIATLGNPEESPEDPEQKNTYVNGLYDINQKELQSPTLQDIVNLFFQHGVDVIRINLAHFPKDVLRRRFLAIKRAILSAENEYQRKVGVLADLPGPKIRFNSSFWLIPKETLWVSFDKIEETLTYQYRDEAQKKENEPPVESRAQINLDEKAFAAAAPDAVEVMLEEIEAILDKIKDDARRKLLSFIGDNDCTLEVLDVDGHSLKCQVISTKNGARLVGSKKGFTIRGISKKICAFTQQDEDKLSALLAADHEKKDGECVDKIISHIGISFCQCREDARKVLHHIVTEDRKRKLNAETPLTEKSELSKCLMDTPQLIAKIETEEGIKNIDEILDFTDGAMIARGDLALEIETIDLPQRSKEIIYKCNVRGKPVIMATQMLESMKTNIECARTEATDVFCAVFDNVDALMLSGETSTGKYPAHVIEKAKALATRAEKYIGKTFKEDIQMQDYFQTLERIKKRAKKWQGRWLQIDGDYSKEEADGNIKREEQTLIHILALIKTSRLRQQVSTDRISHAACMMSADPVVEAIVAPTTSGRTARMLARFRPRVWIYAQPHSDFTGRKLNIDRGVWVMRQLPVEANSTHVDKLIEDSKRIFRADGPWGCAAIFTCGTPLGRVGSTNLIQRWDV